MSEAAISGRSTLAMAGRRAMTPTRVLIILWTTWSLAMIFMTRASVGALDLGDTDNYMRLAEWRDFLGGQNWFDLTQHRFIGPEDGDMHFSRLPDALMSALYWLASLVIGPAAAEQFVLLAFPPLLFLWFLAMTAAASKSIGGAGAAIAAIVLGLLASTVTHQFVPGRIDHHGLALALSMTAFAALLASFRNAAFAAGVAVAGALAAAVSLETAPVAAAAFAVLTARWILSGDRAQLRGFGVAMFVAAPAILFATLGASSFSDAHCDAFAPPAAAALTGAGVLALVFSVLPLKHAPVRAGAAAIGAAMLAAALWTWFPHCVAGPFEGMDPLVRSVWLSSVTEIKSPLALLRKNPGALISFYAFPLAAIGVGVLALRRAPGEDRSKQLAALAFLAFASLLLLAAVRGAGLATAFAIIPFSTLLAAASRPVRLFPPQRLAAFLAIFLVASPASYVALGAAAGNHKEAAGGADSRSGADGESCDNAQSMKALQALPASLLFTPIDLGPALLVQTDHQITAAPYHRNDLSMRRTIVFFTADDAAARAVFDQSGARYLVFCPNSGEAAVYRSRAPEGLAARLAKGAVPDWLSPVDVKGAAPLQIFRRPAS